MATYSKQQYRYDLRVAEENLLNAKAADAALHAKLARIDFVALDDSAKEAWQMRFNDLSELVYRRQCEKRAIEKKWEVRNWTGADHATAGLVAQNID